MKRVVLSAFIAMATVCSAFAQKGESAVGINVGVAPCLESGASITNFGVGAKYQYGLTDALRLEGNFNYGFKNKGVDVMELSANMHYLFSLSDRVAIYPLVGVGYGRIGGSFNGDEYDYLRNPDKYLDGDNGGSNKNEDGDGSSSVNKLLVNVGAGVEYALSSNLSIGLEVKYQYIKDFNRLPVSLGVTYKF